MSVRELPTGLMLVHGNQPERLRDLIVQWISQNPVAPLEKEVMLVQSNGIAQWLKLAFAADPEEGGCGVAAAFEMSLPSRFLWQVYRAVLGTGAVPAVSPFDKSRLTWRLMRMLPALLDTPGYEPLKRFMAQDDDRRKRFQLAQRVADLFDQYQVYRADWLAAWAAHEDVVIDARNQRAPLPADARWQAALWRALLDDVGDDVQDGIDLRQTGRAAVHAAFMRCAESWREGDDGSGDGSGSSARPKALPRRIVVFGVSSLPRQSVEVLAALARWTQVLLCVHNPCMHYWADIVADQDLLRARHARQRRRAGAPAVLDDSLLHLHAQPLLAAWGKQGRDFIGLLDEYDSDEARASYAPHFTRIGQRIDLFDGAEAHTLLQQLQDDIRELRPLHETREQWPAVDPHADESIRFHVAHSAQREVEILHDRLLAAFAADPALRPRDVIVMVPDIEVYTPHIQAVFGLLDADDSRYIPFSVADRTQRTFDPLVGALEMLLALPQSRVSVSDVLDLLEVPAVRARFGIDAEDVPTLRNWIDGANIRWGLHATQRASLGLPQADEMNAPNSWAFGLRRMLLGYAAGDSASAWRGIEPYADIGGLDAALLGPLTRLVDALDSTWQTLREPATVEVWCERLRALKAAFFATGDPEDAYTLERLDGALETWREACAEARLTDKLPLAIVAENWLDELAGGGLQQRFFAGAVTFATLMPMRAIPFRRVCLLGMNDGDYPRNRVPLDFDLMRRDYRPGDRSRREDDRYLFLEALLSARDHLHISWIGRSVTDNTPRPPSVLVGQLRDHLKTGWRLEGDEDAPEAPEALLDALTIEHRLQPFSADYFPAQPHASPLYTYAHEWSRPAPVADAAAHAAALPPPERDEPLSIDELAAFLRDPVRSFFQQRLRVAFQAEDAASENQEPFEVDTLQAWQLQSELIRAQAAAMERGDDDLEPVALARLERMHRSGDLAAGGFGEVIGQELLAPMGDLFAAYRKALARWPEPLEHQYEIRLDASVDGRTLTIDDWIDDLRAGPDGTRGRVILDAGTLVKANKYRGERLAAYWVAHVAAQLAAGEVTTVIVSKAGVAEFSPVAPEVARDYLTALLGAWDAGLRRPLPLAVKTAFAWLRRLPDAFDGSRASVPAEAWADARATFEGNVRSPGECETNPWLRRAYADFDALVVDDAFITLSTRLLLPVQRAPLAASRAPRDAAAAATTADGDTA